MSGIRTYRTSQSCDNGDPVLRLWKLWSGACPAKKQALAGWGYLSGMVWHGKVWCGANQAKKQAPHLKTGSPMLTWHSVVFTNCSIVAFINWSECEGPNVSVSRRSWHWIFRLSVWCMHSKKFINTDSNVERQSDTNFEEISPATTLWKN